MAHSVAVLREARRLDYRLMAGQGDFRMAASSGIVFAEALLGRDGRVSAHPGAWYPEEVLSLNRVEASLRRAGIDVTKTDRPRSGGLSLRPLTKKGACSRLAQSPPASRPNPTGSVSHAPRLRHASASGRAHRLRESSRISRVPRGIVDEDDV